MRSNYKKNKTTRSSKSCGKGRYVKKTVDTAAERDDNKRAVNDASWYHHNDQLVKDAGRFSFNRPIGAPLNLFRPMWDANEQIVPMLKEPEDDSSSFRLPGIMVLDALLTYGFANGSGSEPINIAANRIYTYVRHQNSGHANYDAPDLMMYLAAMDSNFALYAYFSRVYGALSVSSAVNRYMPKYVVEAMGFSYDDLITHLADFRAYLNMFAVRLNSLMVPKVMDIFQRHAWLFSSIYTDAPTIKAQMYMFRPARYYIYKEKTDPGVPAHLKTKMFPGDNRTGGFQYSSFNRKLTFANVRSIIEEVLAPVIASETFNIMSGDIMKAYGQENCYNLSMLADTFTTAPVYNQTVLEQIHNATVFSGFFMESGGVTDAILAENVETGQLTSILHPRTGWCGDIGNHIIAADKDSPTEDDVFEYTRFTVGIDPGNWNHIVPAVDNCGTSGSNGAYFGTEMLTFGHVRTLTDSGAVYPTIFRTADYVDTARIETYIQCEISRQFFHNYPISYIAVTKDIPANNGNWMDIHNASLYVRGDVDSMTIMDPEDLRAIHEVALLSLFNVV